MKTLKIYQEKDEFIIERVNELAHTTKQVFTTEEDLKEGLDAYRPVIDEFHVEVSEDLWSFVINYLNQG